MTSKFRFIVWLKIFATALFLMCATFDASYAQTEPSIQWSVQSPFHPVPQNVRCSCLEAFDWNTPMYPPPPGFKWGVRNNCPTPISLFIVQDMSPLPQNPPALDASISGRRFGVSTIGPSQDLYIDAGGVVGGVNITTSCPSDVGYIPHDKGTFTMAWSDHPPKSTQPPTSYSQPTICNCVSVQHPQIAMPNEPLPKGAFATVTNGCPDDTLIVAQLDTISTTVGMWGIAKGRKFGEQNLTSHQEVQIDLGGGVGDTIFVTKCGASQPVNCDICDQRSPACSATQVEYHDALLRQHGMISPMSRQLAIKRVNALLDKCSIARMLFARSHMSSDVNIEKLTPEEFALQERAAAAFLDTRLSSIQSNISNDIASLTNLGDKWFGDESNISVDDNYCLAREGTLNECRWRGLLVQRPYMRFEINSRVLTCEANVGILGGSNVCHDGPGTMSLPSDLKDMFFCRYTADDTSTTGGGICSSHINSDRKSLWYDCGAKTREDPTNPIGHIGSHADLVINSIEAVAVVLPECQRAYSDIEAARDGNQIGCFDHGRKVPCAPH